MCLKFLIYAIGFALFKWYHIHQGLNEISFYFSTWVFVMLTYICVICVVKKQTMIVSTAVQDGFLLKTLGAKFFDFLSGIFLLQAIALTTITSAKALQSILPLVILMMTFWIQRSGISLKEKFHLHKYIGIGCIVVGSMLLILVSG
ncbi:hypothetical protein MK079_05550 [Candidatus Gracilibacteria bacterium]|nr:hypothetical protein [Candidatus Gracilibacteria bacterium]